MAVVVVLKTLGMVATGCLVLLPLSGLSAGGGCSGVEGREEGTVDTYGDGVGGGGCLRAQ